MLSHYEKIYHELIRNKLKRDEIKAHQDKKPTNNSALHKNHPHLFSLGTKAFISAVEWAHLSIRSIYFFSTSHLVSIRVHFIHLMVRSNLLPFQ